jgi:putative nucleotidyltransferase with HDIG domain
MELLEEPGVLAEDFLSHHALIKALAEADDDTYRHSLEVAVTATAVGARLGLDRAQLVEVELGAVLHDVGKLCLPPALLTKPGKLTPAELHLIRCHPEWGAEMVAQIPGLETVAEIVRRHHERPDGTGYPHGLTHDRIPLAARIISVCDAYGAMTKRRPYRVPLRVKAALTELQRHAGTQFDAEVVTAMVAYISSAREYPSLA